MLHTQHKIYVRAFLCATDVDVRENKMNESGRFFFRTIVKDYGTSPIKIIFETKKRNQRDEKIY